MIEAIPPEAYGVVPARPQVTHSVQGGEIARLIKRLKKATEVDPDLDADIHSVVLQPIEAP